jgi:hypothetical protein
MDCVNHSGVNATAYCQSCGKALCTSCTRLVTGGQILCDACINAWRSAQPPFVPSPPHSGPNPATAAALGVIPGVGAMYNGQFFKGFIHVAVFAVLVSLAEHFWVFGLFIAAWVFYQSFEAYHTARALRDGLPAPDPFGLNEVANRLNVGIRPPYASQPGAGPAGYQPPASGAVPPPPPPYPNGGLPPVSPFCWHQNAPVGAIVLIALGLLFLMGQLDIFHHRLMEFAWPLMLIALGVWLIVRRIEESQGGSK